MQEISKVLSLLLTKSFQVIVALPPPQIKSQRVKTEKHLHNFPLRQYVCVCPCAQVLVSMQLSPKKRDKRKTLQNIFAKAKPKESLSCIELVYQLSASQMRDKDSIPTTKPQPKRNETIANAINQRRGADWLHTNRVWRSSPPKKWRPLRAWKSAHGAVEFSRPENFECVDQVGKVGKRLSVAECMAKNIATHSHRYFQYSSAHHYLVPKKCFGNYLCNQTLLKAFLVDFLVDRDGNECTLHLCIVDGFFAFFHVIWRVFGWNNQSFQILAYFNSRTLNK